MIIHPRQRGEHPDWRSAAACRDTDPELFFPEGTAGPALLLIDQAKWICQSCPVQKQCLRYALEHRLRFGIWGGTTDDERRAIRNAVAWR